MAAARVAVTGLGLITGAGDDVEKCWTNITAGITGIRQNTLYDTTELLSSWAGQVTAEQPADRDRCYALAVTAAGEALRGSGIDFDRYDPTRIAVVAGSSLGAMPTLEQVHRDALTTGVLDAAAAVASQLPRVADVVAEEFGLQGPRIVTSNACAAGSVAIGYAAELLWHGDVDVVLCGGVDPLAALSTYGFSCLGALDPEPCSPLSASTGLTLGEGAGFMVLERTSAAVQREATVYAEVSGYGLTCDGYHQTAPDPVGKGATAAMAEALRTAGLTATDIDYVNLHGTGTPTNDAVEPKALRALFGDAPLPPASSSKSILGHTLGAAGAVEAIISVLAIHRGTLPPTITTRGTTDHHGLDVVPDVGREADPSVVVSNSFAFGGNNASVVLTAPSRTRSTQPPQERHDVVVTGVAGLAGSAGDTAALLDALTRGRPVFDGRVDVEGRATPFGGVDTAVLAKRINPARARRMDALSILSAAVVADLYARHGKPSRTVAEDTGIVFGTGYGPLSSVSQFHAGVVGQGMAGANALVFPNTVVNAPAGHLAMLNRYRGYTATISCGGTSSIAALHLAARVIARGAAARVMIVIADEFPPIALRTAAGLPGYSADGVVVPGGRTGTVLTEGAAAILLESADVAGAAGDPVLARVEGFGSTGDTGRTPGIAASGSAWARALQLACADAGVAPADVHEVVSAASGDRRTDTAQRRAFAAAGLGGARVHEPKAVLGETFGSAAALGLVGLLAGGPTGSARRVLVSAAAAGGGYAGLVVQVPA